MIVQLCDVCDFQGGSQPPKEQWISEPKDGYIRMLQIRDFTQGNKVIPEYVKVTNTIKICSSDDILIARYGASVGKILTGLEGAYNVAIMKTIPDERYISKKYLYYFLNSNKFQNTILNVGSRAAQAGFNKEDLKSIFIKCPDLEEQQKIAAVLDKVSDLITLRKKQLEKLEELVKARFVEMFGDPIYNSQHFPTTEFVNVVTLQRGYDLPVYNRNSGGLIPIYGANGILDYHNEAKSRNGVITGRSGTIGKVYYCEGFFWPLNTTLFSIDNHGNNVIYLAYLLQYFNLKRFYDGTGVPTLNRNIIHKKQIINIPIELQEQFANFVTKVDKQKLTIQKSLDKLEILKKALMQEYFG